MKSKRVLLSFSFKAVRAAALSLRQAGVRALVLAALVLGCAGAGVRANDSAFTGVGGSLRPLRGEHRAVRMVREEVRIEVHGDHYRTQVDFEFRNETNRPVTVTMGFPETGHGDVDSAAAVRSTTFRRFATWVDDQQTPAQRTIARRPEEGSFTAYWTKQVRFAPNQTRRVRVEYESPFSTMADPFSRRVPYDFTGGNWRGQVAESLLTIRIIAPGLHALRALISPRSDTAEPRSVRLEQNGDTFTHRWRNWEAEGFFELSMMTTVPDGLSLADGRIYGEAYESFQRRDTSDGRLYLTVPASSASAYNPNLWPPLLRRDGRLFVALGSLRGWLDDKATGAGRQDQVELDFNDPATVATLRAGSRRMEFRAGTASVRVDNASNVALPAAPFILGEYEMYVPLDEVLRILNGTARTDETAGRVTLNVPAFW